MMIIITKCGVLLPLWLYHWIMRYGSSFKSGWVERWEEWLYGIHVSVAAVITLKQKWLISVHSPHWGVVPGSDPSPVQRQQSAVHIIAMRKGWRHHCLRPPNHQLGQRAFFLIPAHPGIPKTFSIGPQITQLTIHHVELNLNSCFSLSHWEQKHFQTLSKNRRCVRERLELGTHLSIAQHDHPHQHHVDVNSQRLLVVNLIHLETKWDIWSQDHFRQRNDISFNCPIKCGPLLGGRMWKGPLIGCNHRPMPALYLLVTQHTDAPHLSPLELSNWKSSTLNRDWGALPRYLIEKYSKLEI